MVDKLKQSLNRIKDYMLDRYQRNLAGLLVLGSVNTGNYDEKESDINTMIFVKHMGVMDPKEQLESLTRDLKDCRFQSQYFHSLSSIKKYLKERKSFATQIVIIGEGGSRVLYTTPEFNETIDWLKKHSLTEEDIKENLRSKRDLELRGYFRDTTKEDKTKYGKRQYRLTQNLLFNVRRSVQALNYLKTRDLVFDLEACLNNLNLPESEDIKRLNMLYLNRTLLNPEQEKKYFSLAENLVDKIIKRK